MSKILIVEDDRRIATALAIRLKTAGYQVVAAYDAGLAVAMAVKQQPDLILLGLSTPGGNGFTVAERVRTLLPTVAEVLDSFAIALQASGIEIRMPYPLPVLRCDKARVGEIFRNLITNAMKYSDEPQK